MNLKGFKTQVNGKLMSVAIPDKKTILLRGTNSLQAIHTLECLLARDFTENYSSMDGQYGYHYEEKKGTSQLLFDTGSIYGKDLATRVDGKIPNIHCIRYLKNGFFRSFYVTNETVNADIDICTTEYNPNILSVSEWFRLIASVNNLIGAEVVKLEGTNIRFNFKEDLEWSIDAQKFVYLIIAECFITSDNYKRVLLLPDIEILTSKQQIQLLELLDNIKGHWVTFSSGNIDFKDVTSEAVTSLNV